MNRGAVVSAAAYRLRASPAGLSGALRLGVRETQKGFSAKRSVGLAAALLVRGQSVGSGGCACGVFGCRCLLGGGRVSSLQSCGLSEFLQQRRSFASGSATEALSDTIQKELAHEQSNAEEDKSLPAFLSEHGWKLEEKDNDMIVTLSKTVGSERSVAAWGERGYCWRSLQSSAAVDCVFFVFFRKTRGSRVLVHPTLWRRGGGSA